MKILPFENRVLISPFSVDEVFHFLACYTKERSHYSVVAERGDINKFYGRLDEEKRRFTLTKKLRHTHNFLPLVRGEVEQTEKGNTVVLVEYKLLPNTLFFFAFNLIVALLLGTIFLIVGNYVGGVLCLFFGLFSYVITVYNFKLQVEDTHKILEDTITL
ncbi:MAG: hypothetical protein GY827_10105 [Cytophagales bacterium]|nr:hypothetical protein [Cytophagales bacterium]